MTQVINQHRFGSQSLDSLGAVAWWCPSFDSAGVRTSTLTDLEGSSDGTLVGMVPALDWVVDTGSGGARAIQFASATLQYVQFGDLSSLLPDNDMSLSYWIKRDSHTPTVSDDGGVYDFGGGSFGAHYPWTNGLIYDNTFSSVRITVGASSVADRTNWTHVLIRRNASFWQFFENGSLTYSQDSMAAAFPANWRIGVSKNTAIRGAFRFDDLRLFSRYVSTSDITSLASARGYQP